MCAYAINRRIFNETEGNAAQVNAAQVNEGRYVRFCAYTIIARTLNDDTDEIAAQVNGGRCKNLSILKAEYVAVSRF